MVRTPTCAEPDTIYELALQFSMTRSEAIAAHIARAIARNSKKRFSSLYADALQELNIMPTPTSSNGLNTSKHADASLDRSHIGSPADGRKLNSSGVQGTDINSGIAASQPSELRPVTATPVDSKTITGSFSGDHRAPNTGANTTDAFKNQAGPRGETGTKGA